MTDTEALVLLILWLAIVAMLALGFALAVLRTVLYDTIGAQLTVREVLVPLWCLLAGREQRERLREILQARETASGTLRDVAEYRAEKRLYEPQHRRPRADRWLSELDDPYLLDRGSPYSWMLGRRWPPYL